MVWQWLLVKEKEEGRGGAGLCMVRLGLRKPSVEEVLGAQEAASTPVLSTAFSLGTP